MDDLIIRGIKINGGATFVKYGGYTFRLNTDMTWTVSPIQYEVLEWDLRTEPPDSYDSVYEADIRGMGNGVYEGLINIYNKTKAALG